MNLKKYLEMIETKRAEMRAILDTANGEERALTKEEREKFEKRLRTYLKRYGTSKLRTWTYWLDE